MITQPAAQLSSPKARREPMIIRTDLYAAILHENRLLNPNQVGASPAQIIGVVFLVIFLAGAAHYWYLSSQLNKLRPLAAELSAKAEFSQRDLQNLRQRLEVQREKVARRTLLMQVAKDRTPMAPLLEMVLATTPPYIELTAFQATNSQKHVLLKVSGRTAARNARLEADKFRLLLLQGLQDNRIAAEAKFIRLEEVQDRNLPSLSAITEFVIELTWNEGTAPAKPKEPRGK